MSELEESESTPDLGPSTWSMDFPVYAKVGLWVMVAFWLIFNLVVISGLTLEGWNDAIRSPLVFDIFLFPIAVGLAGWLLTRSRSLILRGDELEYTTRLGRTRSMKLEEIVKAKEAIHSVLKVPVKLVIQDQHGQKCVVYSWLMGVPDFQKFHEALKGRLNELGILERVKANQ